MGSISLKGKGRRWLLGGHPWIYADDIAAGTGEPGELIPVFDPNENPMGWGLFSTHSKISIRMVTRSAKQPARDFWMQRVERALASRRRRGELDPAGACRLIHGDAEGLPGLVVDRYADVLVLQSGCQGSDRMRDFLLELILEALEIPVRAVLDRSDSSVRRLEALEPRTEWLRGEAQQEVIVQEAGLQYVVSPEQGHKTGHYLDQRINRQRAADWVRGVKGARVLDAFAYDGLFGIRAALAGAEHVLCIEKSATACERIARNAELNGVSDRVEVVRADAMTELRRRSKAEERYHQVIVDPPAFARNRREVDGAARGYCELNLRAMHLLEPGGQLVSASCSYNIRTERFREFLSQAAFDSGRDVYLEEMAGAALDHPVLLTLPESGYLKCAFLRVE